MYPPLDGHPHPDRLISSTTAVTVDSVCSPVPCPRTIRAAPSTTNLAPASFVSDAAIKTGTSKTAIKRSVRRAKKIDAKVRARIRDNPEIANSGVEFDALASLDAQQQKQAVKMVEDGKAKTVREARDKIAPPAPRAAPAVRDTEEHALDPSSDQPTTSDSVSSSPATCWARLPASGGGKGSGRGARGSTCRGSPAAPSCGKDRQEHQPNIATGRVKGEPATQQKPLRSPSARER